MHEYVGTIVGESTTTEFRIALAHEAVREQDIIAVDAELESGEAQVERPRVRVWIGVLGRDFNRAALVRESRMCCHATSKGHAVLVHVAEPLSSRTTAR